MKNQIVTLGCLVLFAAAVFTACKKDNSNSETAFQTTSTDLATVEDLSEQGEVDADQAIEDRGGPTGGCPTITSTEPIGTFPNTITVDFGTDGCTRPNGRTLKGIIIIDQSAAMTEPGATRTVAYQSFFVNDVQVEGSHTATSNGLNAAGQPFRGTGTKTLTWPDGKTAIWASDHTVTQTAGAGTPELADNVWRIEGGCSGTNRNGQDFNSEITKPLVKRADCRWITEGTRTIEQGIRSRTIDFGNGDCDNEATVTTANGNVFVIKLRG